LLSIY